MMIAREIALLGIFFVREEFIKYKNNQLGGILCLLELNKNSEEVVEKLISKIVRVDD